MRSIQLRLNGLLAAPPAVFLGLFFAYPLAKVLTLAADPDAWRWATGAFVRGHLATAFWMAVLSVVATFLLAVPLAWHHHRRRIPYGGLHMALHAAPFVLPVFVVVHGLRNLAGPGGITQTWLGLDVLSAIGPFATVVVAHAYYNYGFTARLLHTALQRRPIELEEAARLLGRSPVAAFASTSLPLLMPAMAGAALLVFLFSFTSFGVVLLMGQGGVATIETLLYQNLAGVFPRHGRAGALAVIQLVINIVIVGAYVALQRRLALPPRRAAPLPARRRDRWTSGAVAGLAAAPVVGVLVGAFRVRGDWTLEAWRALIDHDHPAHVTGFDLGAAITRSMGYAVATVTLTLLLCLLMAYGLRGRGALRRPAQALSALPLGTSSVLLGFAFLVTFGAGAVLDLRGSAGAIVIAHVLVALPFVARVLWPAVDQLDPRLDDAARMLGAGPARRFLQVHVPALRPVLFVSAGFAAAMSLGDFGASLLLMREETMSLAVWIARHDQPFRLLMQAQATALTAVLATLATAAYLLVAWPERRHT